MHPKCFIHATKEVIDGASVELAIYAPDIIDDFDPKATGYDGGQFSGWTFSHKQASLFAPQVNHYFYNQVPTIDPALKSILEEAIPGTYLRNNDGIGFHRDDTPVEDRSDITVTTFQKIKWNPLLPAALLSGVIYMSYQNNNVTVTSGIAMLVNTVWLGMAIYNFLSGNKLIKWLYS